MPANYGQSARLAEKASRELAQKIALENRIPKTLPKPSLNSRSKKRAASEMEGSCSPEQRRVRAAPRYHRSALCQSTTRRSKWAVPEDSDEDNGDETVAAHRSIPAGRAKRINSVQPKIAAAAAAQRQDGDEEGERTPLAETQLVLSATIGPDPANRVPHALICRLQVFPDTATSPPCRLLYSAKFFLSSSSPSSSTTAATNPHLTPCGEIEAWRLLPSTPWDELLHLDFRTIDTTTDERGECARLLQTLFLPSGALKDHLVSSSHSLSFPPLSTSQDLMHVEKVWIYDAFERQGLLESVLRGFRLLVVDSGLDDHDHDHEDDHEHDHEEKKGEVEVKVKVKRRRSRFRFPEDGVVLLAPGKFDDRVMSRCWKGVPRQRVERVLQRIYAKYGGFELVVEEGLSEMFVTTVMGRLVGGE
ncbi:hypothetical protein CERZMDRAFT_103251 [Cercospora zeae-maydis SCOH1-5]|uniref:Uncharacterized protein n=1 Tax=Cercospora zeae-maydis SCOH1-5 TaxID=717836 RepID=A0A6A6F2Q0_9PEZI|nr:hypothetical protein CERZMDRAFT_103251 [Cercospora zeae-maydis SCOH1-5]